MTPEEATKKFANVKAISSDQYFGNRAELDVSYYIMYVLLLIFALYFSTKLVRI